MFELTNEELHAVSGGSRASANGGNGGNGGRGGRGGDATGGLAEVTVGARRQHPRRTPLTRPLGPARPAASAELAELVELPQLATPAPDHYQTSSGSQLPGEDTMSVSNSMPSNG